MDDYATRQAVKDSDYRNAYKDWLATLTPEELAELKEGGVDAPLIPHSKASGVRDHDMADDPLASYHHDMAGEIDDRGLPHGFTEPDAKPDDGAPPLDTEAVWDILRRLIGELLCHRNAKLSLECLALVSGVAFSGDSETEIARRHGLSRQAVCKRCVELTDHLGLPPSRAMRSVKSRKTSAAARRNRVAIEDGIA